VDVPDIGCLSIASSFEWKTTYFQRSKVSKVICEHQKWSRGWVANFSPDGSYFFIFFFFFFVFFFSLKLISAGYRNPFDIAFNEAGDFIYLRFGYGVGLGMPVSTNSNLSLTRWIKNMGWEQESKMVHLFIQITVSCKTINIGQGSPTNVHVGTELNFPEEIIKKRFMPSIGVWTNLCFDLKPNGANLWKLLQKKLFLVPTSMQMEPSALTARCISWTVVRKIGILIFTECIYDGRSGEKISNHFQVAIFPAKNKHEKRIGGISNSVEPSSRRFEKVLGEFGIHTDRFVQYRCSNSLEHQPIDLGKLKKPLSSRILAKLTQAMIAMQGP